MKRNRIFTALLILSLAAISCNLPAGQAASAEPAETFTPVAGTLPPALTGTSGPSPTACNPSITTNSNVNVRSGPGTAYGSVDNLTAGTTVTVSGKNSDSSWWQINRPAGGTGWVSASVSTANCIPDSLAIITAPPISSSPATSAPTSGGASGTCKGDYVWRLINASDKVCVSPSSKAQADADNAEAANRLYTSAYGPDTCMEGYTWRNAFPGDHVCVTSNVILQTAQDNAAAASRVDPGGIYGPDSCIDGHGWVWRDAGPNDHVCVTGAVRTQAAQDNAAAEARKAINFYGADACFTAFVWREAFPGDHVCVLPAQRTQAAADNAAAPSHTWP